MKKLVRMSSSRDLKKLDPAARDEACRLILSGEQVYFVTDEEDIVTGPRMWKFVYYKKIIHKLSTVWSGSNFWL